MVNYEITSHVSSELCSGDSKFQMLITRVSHCHVTSKFYPRCSFSMFYRCIMKKKSILKILGNLDFNFENHHCKRYKMRGLSVFFYQFSRLIRKSGQYENHSSHACGYRSCRSHRAFHADIAGSKPTSGLLFFRNFHY